MAKWILETRLELVPVPIDPRHFKQLVAEIGELLYDYFCQLDQRKFTQAHSTKTGNSQVQTRDTLAAKRMEDSHE